MVNAFKSSAYLCIFDDWTMLDTAIERIAEYVDEIVVVDGAYEWMAPLLEAEGRNPAKSLDEMMGRLSKFGSKVRYINRTWANETEKRKAGYAACSHRYIWRIDADEILFIDDAALGRFLDSGKAVASMEMPLIASPGLYRHIGASNRIERQPLLFDREQISSEQHLSYLWLVLSASERANLEKPIPRNYFEEPIAFNAHLSSWRPLQTSLGRARFYTLNYLRGGAATPWLPGFAYTAELGFSPLVTSVGSVVIQDALKGHSIVVGMLDMKNAELRKVPLPRASQELYFHHWAELLASLAEANEDAAKRPRNVARGESHHFDLTTQRALQPFISGENLVLTFDRPMHTVTVKLYRYFDTYPWMEEYLDLQTQTDSHHIAFKLPEAKETILRDILRLNAWGVEIEPFYKVQVGLH